VDARHRALTGENTCCVWPKPDAINSNRPTPLGKRNTAGASTGDKRWRDLLTLSNEVTSLPRKKEISSYNASYWKITRTHPYVLFALSASLYMYSKLIFCRRLWPCVTIPIVAFYCGLRHRAAFRQLIVIKPADVDYRGPGGFGFTFLVLYAAGICRGFSIPAALGDIASSQSPSSHQAWQLQHRRALSSGKSGISDLVMRFLGRMQDHQPDEWEWSNDWCCL